MQLCHRLLLLRFLTEHPPPPPPPPPPDENPGYAPGNHFGIFPTEGSLGTAYAFIFWKNSQDQFNLVPLSASGPEKRQFQPAKNPGQRFLLSSLDGAAWHCSDTPLPVLPVRKQTLREIYVCVPRSWAPRA